MLAATAVSALGTIATGRFTRGNDVYFSRHAELRMQQRGIPRLAVDVVLAYGRVSHDHHGGCVVWLDKRARARLCREVGQRMLRLIDNHLYAYAVTDPADGTVLTVGHRYRRIRLGEVCRW